MSLSQLLDLMLNLFTPQILTTPFVYPRNSLYSIRLSARNPLYSIRLSA